MQVLIPNLINSQQEMKQDNMYLFTPVSVFMLRYSSRIVIAPTIEALLTSVVGMMQWCDTNHFEKVSSICYSNLYITIPFHLYNLQVYSLPYRRLFRSIIHNVHDPKLYCQQ